MALGFLAGALALGLAAPTAEARAGRGFISNRAAAQRVSRMPGVLKARSIGRTPRFIKVSSHAYGKNVRVRYLNKRTGAVAATSRNLVPRAKQLVALHEGRGGRAGGDTRRDYAFRVVAGDATGHGLPLLTNSGKQVRIGLKNSKWNPVTTRNRLVSITSGRAGRISTDPADGRRNDQ